MENKELKKITNDVVKIITNSKATFFCGDKKQARKLDKDFKKCAYLLGELQAEICTNVEMYFYEKLKTKKWKTKTEK